jgi:hypothetical protein
LPSTVAAASPGLTCGAFGDGKVVVDDTTSVVVVELTELSLTTTTVVVEPFDLGIVATDACPCGTVEAVEFEPD